MAELNERYQSYARKLAEFSQQHLLAFWDELTDPQREQLLDDLDRIDFARCAPLVNSYVRNRPAMATSQRLDPPPALPAEPGDEHAELYGRALQIGAEAIRGGRVAAFTVAGGQGTRLGYDGPKGAYEISPVRQAPLFQLFAEGLRGTHRRFGNLPRWYIMTSDANHEQTVQFFEQHAYFGLSPEGVKFFRQGLMPAFLPDGRIALAEKHRVALSPDGHGGSLRALAESGALDDMRQREIDTISYFQVDNPLVRVIDPLFVGLHLITGSEMSSKAAHKAHDFERVGVFGLIDGKLGVIEYSDLPETLATAKNDDGSRRFDAGNIAIHLLSVPFVGRVTAAGAAETLPWHRADKKVAVVDEAGQRMTPSEPNVVKLEMFVFDAIPLAQNPLVLFTRREEEFSPVKNAQGDDSPATTRRDLIRRAARWLEACGHTVPRGADGEPAMPIEISPAYALDAADLQGQLKQSPELTAKEAVLLA